MFRHTNKDKLVIELSHDHKPTRAEEKERSIFFLIIYLFK
jgi:hypothetical protein